jgi:hypothetical protein
MQSEGSTMDNSQWAGTYATQRLEQMRHEAEGSELLRRARADADDSGEAATTPERSPIRAITGGLVRRAGWRSRVAVP